MKTIVSVIAAVAILVSCSGVGKLSRPKNPTKFAESITSAELKEMLYIYASDEFAGRLTGDEGQKKAVNFIRQDYKKNGIPAAQSNGDYFQKVPLKEYSRPTTTFALNDKEYSFADDYILVSNSGNFSYAGEEIVFLGYGLNHENYNDYKNVDVTGKYVVILSGEPKDADGNYITTGTKEPKFDTRELISLKSETAEKAGAKGILYYNAQLFPRYSAYFKRHVGSSMSLEEKKGDELPFYFISEALTTTLVPNFKGEQKAAVIPAELKLSSASNSSDVDTENVAAIIRGSEFPNEYIIISAHLDHEGVKDGKVYNGADDDGSGTVAVMEIAEAFALAKKKGQGPRRSIVFLNVTGEEKGLLGSSYYTDKDPIFPLDQTISNLNIDMIGRIDDAHKDNPNYIYLIGSDKLSTELHNISEQMNEKYGGINLDYTFNDENDPNRFYYRSDHYNFAKNNVPVIFYFNGTHADYHKPTDTPEKIDYDLLEKRTRLIFHTAWELANRDQRIIADKAK